MKASVVESPAQQEGPGRFTRVSVQTAAGELEARLSERGNWELRVRRDQEAQWRLACSGDLDQGVIVREAVEEDTLVRGPVTVHPGGRRVVVNGNDVRLARKEFAIVLTLAGQPERVFNKEELMVALWGQPHKSLVNALSTHAYKARQKLKAAGCDGTIVNCWGVGYRFWDRGDLMTFPPLAAAGSKVSPG